MKKKLSKAKLVEAYEFMWEPSLTGDTPDIRLRDQSVFRVLAGQYQNPVPPVVSGDPHPDTDFDRTQGVAPGLELGYGTRFRGGLFHWAVRRWPAPEVPAQEAGVELEFVPGVGSGQDGARQLQ